MPSDEQNTNDHDHDINASTLPSDQVDGDQLDDEDDAEATYELTICVTVHEKKALYEAARATYLESSPTGTDEEIDSLLKPHGPIDVEACLVIVGDPGNSWDGTQIEESACEREPTL